ncbi:hypothetical protein H8S21_08440 [Erwinia persicina]|uniref:hypothetical protein n=1 Tax=Erwinia persicina TaxID=55211 RepID=UPI00165482DD|nr:hypothetical protein [Erwinia persicina]MBC3945354.1 hypothetical protein [Erwinia persicina]
MFKKDVCGWAGILLGSIALLLVITHFMAGPFAPRPSLESIVATKTLAIKHAALDALHGKPLVEKAKSVGWNIDRILSIISAMMGAGAVILGIIGWARKEEHRVAAAAGLLGLKTIAFQPAMAIVAAIILAVLIAGVLQGLLG